MFKFLSTNKAKAKAPVDPKRVYDPSWAEERRRALRFPAPEVKVRVHVKPSLTIKPKVIDLSTLGIGIFLDQMPQEEGPVELMFEEPIVLAGLTIQAERKNCFKIADAQNNIGYRVGFEFTFRDKDQNKFLNRWLALKFQQKKQEEEEKKALAENAPKKAESFYESPEIKKFSVRFPQELSDYEVVLETIKPLALYHGIAQTKLFTSFHESVPMAVLPLLRDSKTMGLKADHLFAQEVNAIRHQDHQIGEILLPSFNSELIRTKKSLSAIHFQKLATLMMIFPYIVHYAMREIALTHLVTVIPSQLEEFFNLWLFKNLGPDGAFAHPLQEPKQGLRIFAIKLESYFKQMAETRPELLDPLQELEISPALAAKTKESYFPETAIFEKWFLGEENLLGYLTSEQNAELKRQFPNISL